MKNPGHWVGLALVLAVPAAAIAYLYSRPAVSGGGGRGTGGEPDRPVRRAVEQKLVPPPLYAGEPQEGLTFRLQSDPQRGDVRSFEHLALYVPAGAPPAQFLPAAPFTATFRGSLRIPTRDRYTFTFVGTGAFELAIDGKTVVTADGSRPSVTGGRLRLAKGSHPFLARYTSPPPGAPPGAPPGTPPEPAILRVYWQSRDFAREPIPAGALEHGTSDSLAQFAQIRAGYHLVRGRRCGRCHAGAVPGPTGPALVGAGSRLRRDWLARWIADPRALRPDATMPKLFHGPAAAADAGDIAAWLATLGAAPAPISFADEERRTGAVLFADQGCIACHMLPDHGDPATAAGRVPLAQVAAKWHPAALVDYLRAPARHHPASGMPDYGFDAGQARAVAAFLLARAAAPPTGGAAAAGAPPAGDAARGAQLAARCGCAACHGMPVANTLRAERFAVTDGGNVACRVADFGFTAAETEALRAYLTRRLPGEPTPIEAVAHEMRASRCVSCHRWHTDATLLAQVDAEIRPLLAGDPVEGIQHGPPDLSFAGGKLRSEWLVRWLAGETGAPPRPWMQMRMPAFAIQPEQLAKGLAFAEGYGSTGTDSPGWHDGSALTVATAPDPAPDPVAFRASPAPELQETGRKLIARDGGLGCIQCHGVGDRAAQEVFEAPGINLQLTPVRLRKEYYHRWMRDPLRIDPATKMTRFADRAGRTGLVDVLDGRAQAQFEVIWRYLQSLPR